MSNKLPSVTGSEVVSALEKGGFALSRTRGCHRVLKHPDGRTTVVPVHAGESIGPGLLRKILRDTKLEKEEFRALLKD